MVTRMIVAVIDQGIQNHALPDAALLFTNEMGFPTSAAPSSDFVGKGVVGVTFGSFSAGIQCQDGESAGKAKTLVSSRSRFSIEAFNQSIRSWFVRQSRR